MEHVIFHFFKFCLVFHIFTLLPLCYSSLLSFPICPFYQDTKLYEYKIFGVQEDLDPELSAQVYMDWEYRKKWDSYVLGEAEQQAQKRARGLRDGTEEIENWEMNADSLCRCDPAVGCSWVASMVVQP